MPLPKSAEEFLDSALAAADKGTVIHLYTFGSEEEMKERKKEGREIIYGMFGILFFRL